MEIGVAEEIFRKCIYCGREFNVEWQGELLNEQEGVCGSKECQKKRKKEKE